MVDKVATAETGTEEVSALRIYEIGYTVIPTVKEDELDGVVGKVRAEIEKVGGNFISEGAPASMKLAYEVAVSTATGRGSKKTTYDRAYFGWIKFEAEASAADILKEALKQDKDILRSIIFRTVREDTRAKMKAPTLREVRRTDTIKSSPRKTVMSEEEKKPVSEADLEKAIKEITTD